MRTSDISKIIGRLDADTLNEMDNQTRAVVRGVEKTGLQGSIAIKITVKKNGKDSVQYSIDPTYKEPRQKPGTQIAFFAFDETTLQATGELSDMPHKQEPLFEGGSNVTHLRASK